MRRRASSDNGHFSFLTQRRRGAEIGIIRTFLPNTDLILDMVVVYGFCRSA